MWSFSGVPEQTPELGFRSLPAHGPGHGHREHPPLRWLQQTEHHTRGRSQTDFSYANAC